MVGRHGIYVRHPRNPHQLQLLLHEAHYVRSAKSLKWDVLPNVHLEGHCDKIMTKCRHGLFPRDEAEFAVTYQDLCEFASHESVEYRRNMAEINLEREHWLGTTTIYFRARKIQYPTDVALTLRFIVDFDNDEDYPPFVHYMEMMKSRPISSIVSFRWIDGQYNSQQPNQRQPQISFRNPVLGELLGTVHEAIPLAINKRVAQLNASDHNALPSNTNRDSVDSEAKLGVIRLKGSTTAREPVHRVFVSVDVGARIGLFHSYYDILAAVCAAPSPCLGSPSLSRSSSVSDIYGMYLAIPSCTDPNENSPLNHELRPTSDPGSLTVTISANRVSVISGANTISPSNYTTRDGARHVVTINYIVGDAFLGTIYGGNNGGRQNINCIHRKLVALLRIISLLGLLQVKLTGRIDRASSVATSFYPLSTCLEHSKLH
ncbi:hypothetical protein AB1N83_010605 [Pleurotus pulmonarius]